MISHRYRAIFVHIPKCGGTSVEDVLWPPPRAEADLWGGFVAPYRNKHQTGGLQHLFARHVRDEVGPETFDAYFKFAVIRNPFTRLISQYRYLMAKRRDLRAYLDLPDDADLDLYLAAIQRRRHVQWEEQHRFVHDERGRLIVDALVRFEGMAAELPLIFERLTGVASPLPHSKPSGPPVADHRAWFTPEQRETVERLYARDLDLFGYAF